MSCTEAIIATLMLADFLTAAMWAKKQGISLGTARQQLWRARTFLEHHPLRHDRDGFYTLNNAARRSKGLPERTRPYGTHGIVRNCVIALSGLTLESPESFSQKWPHLVAPGVTGARHCLGENAMFYVEIDYAKNFRRLIRKLLGIIQKRNRHEAWRELISEGRFRILVITGAESKAAKIRKAAKDKALAVDVIVIPELFNLLGEN